MRCWRSRPGPTISRSSPSRVTRPTRSGRGRPATTGSICGSAPPVSRGRSTSSSNHLPGRPRRRRRRRHRRPDNDPSDRHLSEPVRAAALRCRPPTDPRSDMDLGLDGARALIGGGSGGLGSAIGTILRQEGAQVGLVSRGGERLEGAATELGALPIAADLSTPEGPATAVAAAVEALGGLDLLVVNSGGPPPGRFEDLDEEAWQKAIDGTLWSTIRMLRAALPHLRAGRDPAILVILSSSAREPIPALTTSNLIRPGLAGLIKSMVGEIVLVRINGLAPGRLQP